MIDEIQAGDKEAADRRMEQVANFEALEVTSEAEQLTGELN